MNYNLMPKCLFYKNKSTCKALMIKNCINCSFYKSHRDYYLDENGFTHRIPEGYTVNIPKERSH